MHFATTHAAKVERLIIADIAPKDYPPHHDHILEGLMNLHTHTPESRGEANQLLSRFVRDEGTRLFLLKIFIAQMMALHCEECTCVES